MKQTFRGRSNNSYCNNLKRRVINQLQNADYGQGLVKSNLFFNLLEDCGMQVGSDEEAQARLNHTEAAGELIRYKEALDCFWYLEASSEWCYAFADPLAADQLSHSTTFTELVQPRRIGRKDKTSITSSEISRSCNVAIVGVPSKKEYLMQLLNSSNEAERQGVNLISAAVKLMYKHHDIGFAKINRFFKDLVKDILQGQTTHISYPEFADKFAAYFQLTDTAKDSHLVQTVKNCLVDQDAAASTEQVSLKRLSILIGLFQFLPSQRRYNPPKLTPVEPVKEELKPLKTNDESRNQSLTKSFAAPSVPHLLSESTANPKLTKAIVNLYESVITQFLQVTAVYRKFDRRSKNAVSFSDFAFVIDDLGLQFDREMLLEMFTHLDRDNDGYLKFQDFIALCSEASQFSKIKHNTTPIRQRRPLVIQDSASSRFMSTDNLIKQTFGETSKKINEGFDLFADVNGGSFSKCLVNEYQKDFLQDKKLRDQLCNKYKSQAAQINYRRDNIGQVLRQMDTRRKMQEAIEFKKRGYSTNPLLCHKPGYIPSFYPSRFFQQPQAEPETAAV